MKKKLLPRKLKPVARNCIFCQKKSSPDYKEVELLKNFITERSKIIGKDRSGICSRHQRGLAKEIKKARFLGLLPFAVQVK